MRGGQPTRRARNPFAGIDELHLPLVVRKQRHTDRIKLSTTPVTSINVIRGRVGGAPKLFSNEESEEPTEIDGLLVQEFSVRQNRDKLISELGYEVAMVADIKYRALQIKLAHQKQQEILEQQAENSHIPTRKELTAKETASTKSRPVSRRFSPAKIPVRIPVKRMTVEERRLKLSQTVPVNLPSYLKSTAASKSSLWKTEEDLVAEPPKPKTAKLQPLTRRSSYEEKAESRLQLIQHQKAKRKILHQSHARDLLARARRSSLVALAGENLDAWQNNKLKMRTNLASLRDEFETKFDSISEIGLDRIKEDSRIHMQELRGQTDRLLAKKRLKAKEELRESETQVNGWKRSRKWLTIFFIMMSAEELIKSAKCNFTDKVTILRKLARTAFRLKLWVHQWKKRYARKQVRKFLVDMMQIKVMPKRIYRFRVSCLLIRRSASKVQHVARGFIACHKSRVVALVQVAVRLEREYREACLKKKNGMMDAEWNSVTEKAACFMMGDIERQETLRRRALVSIIDTYLDAKRREHVRLNFPIWKDSMLVFDSTKKGFDTDDVKKILQDPSEQVKRQERKNEEERPKFPKFYPDRVMQKEMAQNPSLFGGDM